jgi:hypothetical protein
MRLLILSLAAAGTLVCHLAAAETQCLPSTDQAVFNVQALRSEMMVLATGCSDDAAYNSFIERYKPALMMNEHEVDAWFKRKYGRRAQFEHDRFVTDLANAQSDAGTHMGTEFCPHNGVMFHEVMALQDSAELASFAAGQDLLPGSLDICTVETKSEPRKAVRRREAERK